MWFVLAVLLAPQQPTPQARADSARADTVAAVAGDTSRSRRRQRSVTIGLSSGAPAPSPADTAGAYLDAAARSLVERARENRSRLNARIRAYHTLVKERISVGLKAMHRDRMLVTQDLAATIDWRRGVPTRFQIVGARQATPTFTRGFRLPGDLKSRAGDLSVDPMDDRLSLGLFDTTFVQHPLAPGSEAYYRFASGDTTTLRLPDGRVLRLVELRVIPRREDVHLLRGSLWIDAATLGVVRGVFRLAADYDLEANVDADDSADVKDIPGIFKPIRAELRYLTVEYGLVDFRWWVLRLVALEGSAQVGTMASFPARYERVYSDYAVEGDTTPAPQVAVAAAAPDTVSEPVRQTEKTCQAAHPGLTCWCHDRRCRLFDVIVPSDTLALLDSPELPPPATSAYDPLITESQLQELGSRLQLIPQQPWHLSPPTLHWGLARAGLVRFNRVEGLSVGARSGLDLGRLTLDATARLGVAPVGADSAPSVRFTPDVVLGVNRQTPTSTYRLAAYRRTTVMAPSTRALGFGNSFNALFFGRDDGDYFRALGVDLTRAAAPGTAEHVTWRLFAERQTGLDKGTDWSLPRLFNGSRRFRPNLAAQRADEAGGELALNYAREGSGLRWSTRLTLDGATGTFDYARPSATLGLTLPPLGGVVLSAEGAAGTSAGTVPVQSSWFLGGPATLRGYPGDVMYGAAFWRGRLELGTALPAARLTVFGDAGWAGPREAYRTGRPLYSAGVGASLLDGYIRLDLSRALRAPTGWRVDLYLDGVI